MELWRTSAQVPASPGTTELSGRADLLHKFNLQGLQDVIMTALHLDYTNPEHRKKYDVLGKLPGPAAMKQLYRGSLPDPRTGIAPPPRWSLLQVANWPPHSYPWPAYSAEDIRAASTFQPGPAVELSLEAQGIPVPPIRVDPGTETFLQQRQAQGTLGLPHEGLATASKAALEAAAAAGSGGIGEDGTGQRARRKASRSASATIAAAAAAEEDPGGEDGYAREDGGGGREMRGGRKRGRR
uniref:Uncharacterized protein n=1 Tax=Dunaliella tertiolecta TaxID=3047 RepID=A0A7S3R460_DUNTE|mmetsp:Transcript_14290/g.38777  ORF Transcript_14290/g.38777 Transcript_14290/m.38777 type:complete len:240 (-) Transcript_14290:310-1029(-)